MSDESSKPAAETVPREGVLLGMDYGTKRIGIAVSTPEQTMCVPLQTYSRQGPQEDADWLKKVVREQRAVGIVVGLPVHMSGDEGTKASEARSFGQWASNVTGLPVAYWDERHTSLIAQAYLTQTQLSEEKRAIRQDRVAANLMLQAFLDAPDRQAKPTDLRGT